MTAPVASSPPHKPTLLALASVARRAAQRFIDHNHMVSFCSILLTCGAVFCKDAAAWALVTFAFLAKGLAFALYARGKSLHDLSREAQRLALLEDSYGRLIDPFQVVELRKRAGVRLEKIAVAESYPRPYYTSHQKAGDARFLENMQQSTFWSRNLLDLYWKRMLLLLVVLLGLVAVFTYILLMIGHNSKGLTLNPYLVSL